MQLRQEGELLILHLTPLEGCFSEKQGDPLVESLPWLLVHTPSLSCSKWGGTE